MRIWGLGFQGVRVSANQGSNLGLLGFRLTAGSVGLWWWSTKRDEGWVVVVTGGGWLFRCARLEFRFRGLGFRRGVAGVVEVGGSRQVVVTYGGWSMVEVAAPWWWT